MTTVDHVLLTRFNLPTGGLEGLVRAREGWLRERAELFELYCAPSVAAQRDARVTWIVYLDPESPQWLLDRVAPYADSGLLVPVLRERVGVAELREDIGLHVARRGNVLLSTNLDNDDAIAEDFCARLQAVVTSEPRVAIYVPNGLVLGSGGLYRLRDRHNAFCSVREGWDRPVTSWSEYHNELPKVMPVIELDGPPGWLQVVHEGNVSNRVRGTLTSPAAHRGRFVVPIDVVEPTSWQLWTDAVLVSPLRRVRDGGRGWLRAVALRLLGKRRYQSLKAGVRHVRRSLARVR